MKYKPFEVSLGAALLLAALSCSFFYNLALQPVYVWDEARRANDSMQMLLTGEWIIDFYDNNPATRGTKSPLLLWLQLASIKIFGLNEWALRFPSAVASVAIGFSIWLFNFRYFKSNAVGVLAGMIFASTLAWVTNHAGRTGDYDALLTLFAILYVFSFYAYCITTNNKWLCLFWIGVTMAVLVKGIAGLFFIPGLFLFALHQKRFKTLLYNPWLYAGILFFVVMVGGYYLFREWHAPGFWQAVYGNELGGRYLQALEYNGQPFLYYFKNFSWRYPYWCYLLLPAFLFGFCSRSATIKKFTVFHFTLAVTFLLLISSSKTKLFWYDLPLYPLFALQIALLLYHIWLWLQQRISFFISKTAAAALAAVFSALLLVLPFKAVYNNNKQVGSYLEDREQGLFLQQAMQQKKNLNNHLFLYEDYDRHIRYYIKRLHLQQVNVQLSNKITSIQPPVYVVVSADSTWQKLLRFYDAAFVEEKYGCQVYFIKAKQANKAGNLVYNNDVPNQK